MAFNVGTHHLIVWQFHFRLLWCSLGVRAFDLFAAIGINFKLEWKEIVNWNEKGSKQQKEHLLFAHFRWFGFFFFVVFDDFSLIFSPLAHNKWRGLEVELLELIPISIDRSTPSLTPFNTAVSTHVSIVFLAKPMRLRNREAKQKKSWKLSSESYFIVFYLPFSVCQRKRREKECVWERESAHTAHAPANHLPLYKLIYILLPLGKSERASDR